MVFWCPVEDLCICGIVVDNSVNGKCTLHKKRQSLWYVGYVGVRHSEINPYEKYETIRFKMIF